MRASPVLIFCFASDCGKQIVLFEQIQRRQCGGAGEGIAGVGVTVKKCLAFPRRAQKCIEYFQCGKCRGQRQVAAGNPFGDAHQVGPNIFMYHAHLDVHPPEREPATAWMWHQDGGIQNRDLETSPRPRMSVKVAYFLTDVSVPDRGNFVVLPGSHRLDTVERPPSGNDIPGAVPILAEPGDAVVFDRRVWHMRSPNRSTVTRKALFLAYTYRWVRPRDDLRLPAAMLAELTPVQRQLAGVGTDDPFPLWMPDGSPLPLRDLLGRD